jgi:hypothetical protein
MNIRYTKPTAPRSFTMPPVGGTTPEIRGLASVHPAWEADQPDRVLDDVAVGELED